MFTLAHSGDRSCGIPDGETFVIVGGGEQIHKFATRWERFQSYGDGFVEMLVPATIYIRR